MASKTAVVNKKKKKTKKRKRNYGAAAANPKKKRRRRSNPSSAAPRRRNTGRKKNPGPFDMDSIIDTVPAATGGVWLGRWATKLAGKFEDNQEGIPEPGIKHAIAIAIAASVGGDMLGNMLGSAAKGEYARISCLGFGGDMFLRKRFMRDSAFVRENLSLEGIGYDDDDVEYEDEIEMPEGMEGYTDRSDLGQDLVQDAEGNLYQLSGGMGATAPGAPYPANYRDIMNGVGAFQNTSALGMAPARADSTNSFGYSA